MDHELLKDLGVFGVVIVDKCFTLERTVTRRAGSVFIKRHSCELVLCVCVLKAAAAAAYLGSGLICCVVFRADSKPVCA